MALEVTKTSTYQNNVSPTASINKSDGAKSVDLSYDLSRKNSDIDIQSIVEQDGDNRESFASEQHIKSEISKANRRLRHHNTRCEFGYHEETGRVTIKVMDKDTEEVIREIPPEKTLEMIQKMWELAGLLVDERR